MCTRVGQLVVHVYRAAVVGDHVDEHRYVHVWWLVIACSDTTCLIVWRCVTTCIARLCFMVYDERVGVSASVGVGVCVCVCVCG